MTNIHKESFVDSLKAWLTYIIKEYPDNDYTKGKISILKTLIKEIYEGKHDKKFKYGG